VGGGRLHFCWVVGGRQFGLDCLRWIGRGSLGIRYAMAWERPGGYKILREDMALALEDISFAYVSLLLAYGVLIV